MRLFLRVFIALVLDPLTRDLTRKAAAQVARFKASTPFVQRNSAAALRQMAGGIAAFEASRARLRARAGLPTITTTNQK